MYCKPDEWKHETISSLHVLVLFDSHLYYIYIYVCVHVVYVYISLFS